MKRIINIGILFIGLAFIFTSCNDKKNTIEYKTLQFVKAESTYWGDFYGTNKSIFDLVLYDNNLSNSPEGNLNGIEIIFDINASTGSTSIPAGVYKSGTKGDAFTFQRGDYDADNAPYGSYMRVWTNGRKEIWLITSGTVEIKTSGQVVINGMITNEDNVPYYINFSGNVKTYDVTPWPESLTKGQAIFESRVTGNNGDRNMFTILLGGNDVVFPGLGGNDDAMRIELYSPTNINNTIVDGTYYVEVETNDFFRIMDGYVGNDNLDYGTWYYTSQAFKILSGDMIVTVTGSTYKLDYVFYTGYNNSGMKIAGIYNGPLTYVDNSKKVKSMMRAPAASTSEIKRAPRTTKESPLTPNQRLFSTGDVRFTPVK